MSSIEFRAIAAALQEGRSADLVRTVEGQTLRRRFLPPERLIILGGGHIARPLCALGAMLDFAVTVVDDRPDFANRQRFPEAQQVLCDDFAHALETLHVRPGDYVCVVTRGHRWDGVCLRALLRGAEPTYLGMIGSRHRVAGLKELLAQEGFDAGRIGRIHAPIGLMIGAVTPAEIAVSICAQLVECRRSRPAGAEESGLMAQTNTDPAFLDLAVRDEPYALLLVLSSTGSTPVKSGAIMAVDALGRGYGTIGGGCGEAAACRQARLLIGTGQRKIVEVDMDNDVAMEDGLVCGGAMRVLLEDGSI